MLAVTADEIERESLELLTQLRFATLNILRPEYRTVSISKANEYIKLANDFREHYHGKPKQELNLSGDDKTQIKIFNALDRSGDLTRIIEELKDPSTPRLLTSVRNG